MHTSCNQLLYKVRVNEMVKEQIRVWHFLMFWQVEKNVTIHKKRPAEMFRVRTLESAAED